MKHVAKIAFFIVLISISIKGNAQCTPDTNLPTWGIFPKELNPATVNVAYSQVIQFKTSVDTVVSGVNAKIDSIFILNVTGLPSGYTYQCNTPQCKANGGEVGCVLLSGTTTSEGHYPLKVAIKTYARVYIFGNWVNQTQTDTNYAYFIQVNGTTGLFEIGSDHQVAVFPNPAHQQLQVLVLNRLSAHASGSVIDIHGKEVYHINDVSAKMDIPLDHFTPGLYFLVIQDGSSVMQKKFSVE